MAKLHSFHIPVMGIGYTIDSPVKVSHFGIDSVISLVDDILMEKLRKMYCEKFEMPFTEISVKIKDFRAKRITSYLNMVNKIAKKKFDDLKSNALDKDTDLSKLLNMLPDGSVIKQKFQNIKTDIDLQEIGNWIKNSLTPGSIDVNIMTKLDKENYKNGEKLPIEFNDAHAALRGYANSDLSSSLVLSAGMSPRLYSYIENFEDFYPDENGQIKKKIALKVSDYRSALIQGKFLAKKGLWVSEFRIESGLNCGGHAFASDGNLMGPILAEFKENRQALVKSVHEILVQALSNKNKNVPSKELPLIITAQGGVGTTEEHDFLIDHYGIDSVGWGSPFLLVPEATTTDSNTIKQLADAKENDLYLSNISPLGVPFNSLRGNTKDIEKMKFVEEGKPGSVCPKRLLVSNTEFTEKAICTASRSYQRIKIKELESKNLPQKEHKLKFDKIIEKSCICVGLGTSALLAHNLDTKIEGEGVSVCPGPNIAYFSKEMSLTEMVGHIYGKSNIVRSNRPHVFIKELNIYIEYIKEKVNEIEDILTKKEQKYFSNFMKNMNASLKYYFDLFSSLNDKFIYTKSRILSDLENSKNKLNKISSKIENLSKKKELVYQD